KETEALQTKLNQERKKTKKRRQNKKELLGSINRSKKLHEQTLKEMEASSREIGNLINNFEERLIQESQYGGGNSFRSLKGRLDFPAKGDIVTFFGKRKDPKFNTTIFQKGIDIAVPEGTEVRAVFDGKILYADWFRGYGKIIIIDHGEGFYSLSAHLSKLDKKVNDRINKGETIALSGDTGSLKGPYLYFEIRKKGKPVDPLDWLKIPLGKSKTRANSRRQG
ncbi:MAG: peptidoglycan DD-metalloendopeptidase family protein, partial [Proteobacteria bacterium]|nr:peptidoglycan DD-metalloendopeptidase family protein [Pseudomonadota bacterium]